MSEIIQYSTVGTAAMAVFSVGFAVISHRRQINASIYLDLSERLHRLLQALPAEVRSAHLSGKGPPASQPGIGLALAADFLHLLNSAHALYSGGYFSGHLWKQLRAQAEQGLQLPAFRACWPQMRDGFSANPKFVAFVEECQAAGQRKSNRA